MMLNLLLAIGIVSLSSLAVYYTGIFLLVRAGVVQGPYKDLLPLFLFKRNRDLAAVELALTKTDVSLFETVVKIENAILELQAIPTISQGLADVQSNMGQTYILGSGERAGRIQATVRHVTAGSTGTTSAFPEYHSETSH